MVQMALDKGYVVNTALTSTKMRSYMLKNEGIMKAIKGVNFVGMAITPAEVANLLLSLYGLNMVIDDDMYGIANKENTTRTPKRFLPDNVFTLYVSTGNGKIGTGLWGVTPEEEKASAFTSLSQKQFITISQWATPDPVAEWTKASGVFIPVIPNPYGIVIGTLTEGESGLDTLVVNSTASQTTNGYTKVSVSPAKSGDNSYKYKVADDCKLPSYLGNVKTYATWDGTSEIEATTGKEIMIIECDPNYRAVKAGITTVTAKDE